LLLSTSAAAGASIVLLLRWHVRHDRMPTRAALELENAYAGIFAFKPSWSALTLNSSHRDGPLGLC
jgi:hypothetical protein